MNISSYILCLVFLGAAAVCDIKKHIIPNRLIWAGTLAALVMMVVHLQIDSVVSRLIAGTAALVLTFLMSYFSKGGIGMGDAKLMMVVGLFLGFGELVSVFFMALVFSVCYGIARVLLHKATVKTEMAFAPLVFLAMVVEIILSLV